MSEKKHNSKKDATDGLAARIKKAMKDGGGCCGGAGCCDTKIVPNKTRETEEKD